MENNKRGRKRKKSVRKNMKFVGDHNLESFSPTNLQRECLKVIGSNKITFVDSPAGVGKSLISLYYASKEYLKDPNKQIVVVRSPVEMGMDSIGFLTGNADEKLLLHFESTKMLLDSLLGGGKVDSDLGKRIHFTIPNFALGHTRNNCIYIIDEAQVMEPMILKLLLERIGEHTTTIVLGSSSQLYTRDNKSRNALQDALRRFFDEDGVPKYRDISKFSFPVDAVMRDEVVKSVIIAYEGENG